MSELTTLAQVLFGGIAVGAAYALIALAMVLIYKTSEVLNFAQGDMATATTFVAFSLVVGLSLPWHIVLPAVIAFAVVLGAGAEFLFLRRAKEPNVLGLIIITLGVQMIVFGFSSWKWGGDPKDLPFPLGPFDVMAVGGVIVSKLELLTIAVALAVIVGLFLFLRFTKLGVAMQAAQQNKAAARLMGIRVKRINMFAWALAASVGALAGLLIAPAGTVDPYMMWDPMLKGFAGAVLGGMTSLPGAAVGGAIVGIAENLFGYYISTDFKSLVPFAIILLVLAIKPSGLLARHYVKKV